jgi:hypothetical protein
VSIHSWLRMQLSQLVNVKQRKLVDATSAFRLENGPWSGISECDVRIGTEPVRLAGNRILAYGKRRREAVVRSHDRRNLAALGNASDRPAVGLGEEAKAFF